MSWWTKRQQDKQATTTTADTGDGADANMTGLADNAPPVNMFGLTPTRGNINQDPSQGQSNLTAAAATGKQQANEIPIAQQAPAELREGASAPLSERAQMLQAGKGNDVKWKDWAGALGEGGMASVTGLISGLSAVSAITSGAESTIGSASKKDQRQVSAETQIAMKNDYQKALDQWIAQATAAKKKAKTQGAAASMGKNAQAKTTTAQSNRDAVIAAAANNPARQYGG